MPDVPDPSTPRLRTHKGEVLASLSILIPAELHREVKQLAARRGASVTSIVREMLDRTVREAG